MISFVNIKTIFELSSDRTIERLSSFYAKDSALLNAIDEITSKYLIEEVIHGKKVLLKPNWVKHNTASQNEICMRTHDQFLLAALEMILKKNPAKVLIGDAPIQGCNWERMITTAFIEKIKNLSTQYGIPVDIKDFRRVTYNPSKNNPLLERNPLSEYTLFDLGEKSLLEPITRRDKSLFRVTNYNPDRLAVSHGPGIHKYCITNTLFENDVVISLPKVKTHQKAGITAALKNIVGLNGDKDFLPHHRMGGTRFGGDCYPGNNILRYLSEKALDNANRQQGNWMFWPWQKLSSLLWRISFPGNEHHLSAAWHGNDTTWRMVMDINKIAVFGKADGTLSETPQRQLFSLCDGIIAGQGDGPLKPEPLALGIISFTNHSAMNDVCMAKLMGFNVHKIPLLNSALNQAESDKVELFLDNIPIIPNALEKLAITTLLAPGWIEYMQQMN